MIFVAGCGSKSDVFVVDIFDIPFYDDGVVYEELVSTPIEGMRIYKEMREVIDPNTT